MKFSTFIRYYLVSLLAAGNLITFKKVEVTDVLARPLNDVRVIENVHRMQKACHYVNIT